MRPMPPTTRPLAEAIAAGSGMAEHAGELVDVAAQPDQRRCVPSTSASTLAFKASMTCCFENTRPMPAIGFRTAELRARAASASRSSRPCATRADDAERRHHEAERHDGDEAASASRRAAAPTSRRGRAPGRGRSAATGPARPSARPRPAAPATSSDAAAGDRGEVAEVARARDLAFVARLLELARRRGKRLVLCEESAMWKALFRIAGART